MRPVLVVGGTAILRPAVESLRADGRAVTVLSRSPDRLARLSTGVTGLRGDLDDAVGLRTALATLAEIPAGALVYLPDSAAPAARAALAALRQVVAGPVVAVLTSEVAAPRPDGPAGEPDLHAVAAEIGAGAADLRVLVLGWVPPTADGPARWHTAEEISTAALAGLDDPSPRRLGVLRPWTQRPG